MRFLFLFLLSTTALLAQGVGVSPLAPKTLVIYNRNDPESVQLARYYGARRGIPDRQIVGLSCPDAEEISRDEYDATIAEPLKEKFTSLGWWQITETPDEKTSVTRNKIRFVALIRGVPLKIREKIEYAGDIPDRSTPYGTTNGSSVDSEIAVLGRLSRQISGPLNNPYFENFSRFDATELPQYMLVGRLDGPSFEDVKRMIDDSLRAERNGLGGWVVLDERGTQLPGYKMGDDWINNAGKQFSKLGFPIFLDRNEPTLPTGLPLPRIAVYYGWYSSDMSGAFVGSEVRFAPGAIACHIHSFSALSVRSRSLGWAGPLVASGAAAVLGNVYEPYLALTASLDIFTERLLRGFTLAEANGASLRAFSWMNVVVGDPLYRPFASLSDPNAVFSGDLADFQRSTRRNIIDSSKPFLAEAWGYRKLLEGDKGAAEVLLQAAAKKYKDPDSVARATWSYTQLLIAKGDKKGALAALNDAEARIRGTNAGGFLMTQILPLEPTPTLAPAPGDTEPPTVPGSSVVPPAPMPPAGR